MAWTPDAAGGAASGVELIFSHASVAGNSENPSASTSNLRSQFFLWGNAGQMKLPGSAPRGAFFCACKLLVAKV